MGGVAVKGKPLDSTGACLHAPGVRRQLTPCAFRFASFNCFVMGLLKSFSPDEIHRYHRVVSHSVDVRSHFEMLVWLQGDMQQYLPHDIMLTAWGDFQGGQIQHNVLSKLAGVRSQHANAHVITPLLLGLFARWAEFGHKPFSLNAADGFCVEKDCEHSELCAALKTMRSVVVHGIRDERGSHDCLYAAFSTKESIAESERSAMALVLPYVDAALRQVAHLPHQTQAAEDTPDEIILQRDFGLSEREAEVLHWVAAGKTNSEIGSILDISSFTVKNHMQRVFKKLDVLNRAQAVSRLKALRFDA